jgi:hypothetical protein
MTRRLLAILFFPILSAADVKVALTPIERPTSGTAAPITVTVSNDGDSDAANIDLKVVLSSGTKASVLSFASAPPWPCIAGTRSVTCGSATLSAHESAQFQLRINPAIEGSFELFAFAQWDEGRKIQISERAIERARFYRTLVVTNTADDGDGSLRQILGDGGDNCLRDEVPCRVEFNIDEPVPDEGWFTIRLQSPLATIGAPNAIVHLVIDATTQTAFSGDTNPDGPEVAIDGSALEVGNGLTLDGYGTAVIRGLAIGGFPWNGIDIGFIGATGDAQVHCAIEENYLGTDATGRHAVPNKLRGISARNPAVNFTIARNVLSGNLRSGVFIDSGSAIDVIDNRIGIAADDSPLGNGAAGIFTGPCVTYCTIAANHIAYNQTGVAIARQSHHIHVDANSIAHNTFLGIDFGVDGFSGYKYDDYDLANPYIPPPRIVSAAFDGDSTTIVGTYLPSPDYWGKSTVSVYANDVEEAQGDRVLGKAEANAVGVFTLKVQGDLRGKFIAAYGQRYLNLGWSGDYFWTSEFSDVVVPVQ